MMQGTRVATTRASTAANSSIINRILDAAMLLLLIDVMQTTTATTQRSCYVYINGKPLRHHIAALGGASKALSIGKSNYQFRFGLPSNASSSDPIGYSIDIECRTSAAAAAASRNATAVSRGDRRFPLRTQVADIGSMPIEINTNNCASETLVSGVTLEKHADFISFSAQPHTERNGTSSVIMRLSLNRHMGDGCISSHIVFVASDSHQPPSPATTPHQPGSGGHMTHDEADSYGDYDVDDGDDSELHANNRVAAFLKRSVALLLGHAKRFWLHVRLDSTCATLLFVSATMCAALLLLVCIRQWRRGRCCCCRAACGNDNCGDKLDISAAAVESIRRIRTAGKQHKPAGSKPRSDIPSIGRSGGGSSQMHRSRNLMRMNGMPQAPPLPLFQQMQQKQLNQQQQQQQKQQQHELHHRFVDAAQQSASATVNGQLETASAPNSVNEFQLLRKQLMGRVMTDSNGGGGDSEVTHNENSTLNKNLIFQC